MEKKKKHSQTPIMKKNINKSVQSSMVKSRQKAKNNGVWDNCASGLERILMTKEKWSNNKQKRVDLESLNT